MPATDGIQIEALVMTPDQARELVSGGNTDLHAHDIQVTASMLRRLQDLETVVYVNADYIARYSDDVLLVTATSPVTITLPLARGGQRLTVTRISGSSTVTVIPSSGDNIDLASSKSITTTAAPITLKAVRGAGYFSV